MDYWSKRLQDRQVESEKGILKDMPRFSEAYERAMSDIEREIESIYKNYSKKYGDVVVLNKQELQKSVKLSERKNFLEKIKSEAKRLKIPLEKVYDSRYSQRLTRLELLRVQLQIKAYELGKQEEKIMNELFLKQIKEDYTKSQLDTALSGVEPVFATMNTETAKLILDAQWQGGNYSKRVWVSTENLANSLSPILASAVLTGQSQQKTAREIRDRFSVKFSDAMRLVRTENNYFFTQTQAQSLFDDGFRYYMINAFLDGRTSEICKMQNGKIYKLSDLKVGETAPPFHPNCRTTIDFATEEEYIAQNGAIRTEKQPSMQLTTQKTLALPYSQSSIEKTQTAEDLAERLKKAAQSQMTNKLLPDGTYNYNADLNTWTQQMAKGEITMEQLQENIRKVLAEIDPKHSLYSSIQMVAKMYKAI